MAFQFKMEKVLSMKKREKEAAQSRYGEAVRIFESLAHSLYGLLKQKEEIEQHALSQYQTKVIVNDLQQTQRFVLSLSQQITSAQSRVQHAREMMNISHQKLMDITMEVKKFERYREKKWSEYQQRMMAFENKQNDEFSILRYARQ